MQEVLTQVQQLAGKYVFNVGGAVVVLVLGWLLALFVSGGVRAALRRLNVSQRVAGLAKTEGLDLEGWVARGVYYVVMLFVLVAFFQALNLTVVTEPLNHVLTTVMAYMPRLVSAGVLFLVAMLLARVLRTITERVAAMKVGGRLSDLPDLPTNLGDIVYALVFVLFLPGILDALNMQGLLTPVTVVIAKGAAFLPNLVGAVVIVFIGRIVANIVSRLVTSALAAAGVDAAAARLGMRTARPLSQVAGVVVYVLMLVPILAAAVNALNLDAVTVPLSNVLDKLLSALPNIFGACLLLAGAWLAAHLAGGLVTSVLAGVGFDTLPVRLGLTREAVTSGPTPARMAGGLVRISIILLAVIEACRLLRFDALALLVTDFTSLLGHVVLGLLIFGLGLYVADAASRVVLATADPRHGRFLALAARVSIWTLATAMALRQMGIANEIINLAFGLILGALAIAIGLAFGLGGREAAARQLEAWRQEAPNP